MVDIKEIKGYFDHGKLNAYPTKRKKQIIALAWISEHIPADRTYSEKEFNALLSELHSFGDPALLRRELFDHYIIERSIEGKEYMLASNRPSLEELLLKYCGIEAEEKNADANKPMVFNDMELSRNDLDAAAEFRNEVHKEALKRVQKIDPRIETVTDPYPVEAYFQQNWDYPGKWYTIVAVPEDAGGREALIDIIVRESLASSREERNDIDR